MGSWGTWFQCPSVQGACIGMVLYSASCRQRNRKNGGTVQSALCGVRAPFVYDSCGIFPFSVEASSPRGFIFPLKAYFFYSVTVNPCQKGPLQN